MADSGFGSPSGKIGSTPPEGHVNGTDGFIRKWIGPTWQALGILVILLGFAVWAVTHYVGDVLADVEQSVNERIDGVEESVNGRIEGVTEGIGSAEREIDDRLDEVAERLSRVEGILQTIRDSLNRNASTRPVEAHAGNAP